MIALMLLIFFTLTSALIFVGIGKVMLGIFSLLLGIFLVSIQVLAKLQEK